MNSVPHLNQTSTNIRAIIEQLYLNNEFRRTLFIAALSHTQDEEVALDIVQDSFLKVLEKSAVLKDNPRGYIYRIVKSRSIDWFRSRQVQQNYAKQVSKTSQEDAPCPWIQLFESQQLMQQYLQKIHLSQLDKKVLSLWQDAYTNQEIAQKLPELQTAREVARVKQNIKRRLLKAVSK